MNVHVLAGNIGADPRLNSINGQQGPISVLNFSLAVQKRQKGQDGKYLTLWVECSLWGTRADALAPYLKKGSKVTVTGESDVETYQANDGSVRAKMTLRINELTMQGSASDQAPAQNQQAQNAAPQGGYQQQQPQQRPQSQPQGQQAGAQQPYNRPQNGPQTGYMNNGAAINNHRPDPAQQAGFNQPQQGFNQQRGPNEPPIDFDDDIPF